MGKLAQRPGTTRYQCTQGIIRQGPIASQGTLPGPAGHSPVALVIHGHKVHEEHVVSHGVHAEELHLEGGEHAPEDRTAGRQVTLDGEGQGRFTLTSQEEYSLSATVAFGLVAWSLHLIPLTQLL